MSKSKMELFLEVKFRRTGWRKTLGYKKFIVQGKLYKVAIKMKNVGTRAVPIGTVHGYKIDPAEGGTISETENDNFDFPVLNPGKSFTYVFETPLLPPVKGSNWFESSISPKDGNTTYTCYQDLKKKTSFNNRWGNAVLVHGILEHQQSKTNRLILLLTSLVFLEGAWGLDIILQEIIQVLSGFFFYLGEIFSSLG